MKDELGKKIIIKFIGLRAKTHSYVIHEYMKVVKIKKAKNAKKSVP